MLIKSILGAFLSFASACLVCVIIYLSMVGRIHPEFQKFMGREADTLLVSGKYLTPVSVAAARRAGDGIVIEEFNNDEAVLAMLRSFRAEDYPFVQINMSGLTPYTKVKFLWRKSSDPSQTFSLSLTRQGNGVAQLSLVNEGNNYAGEIMDAAVLFYDGPELNIEHNNHKEIWIHGLELRPFSQKYLATQIVSDWTHPPLLTTHSNNIVKGIHSTGIQPPNIVAIILIVVALILASCFQIINILLKRRPAENSLLATAVFVSLLGWAFNDVLRWHWRASQAVDTYVRYSNLPLQERIKRSDVRCSMFQEDCAENLLPHF